MLALAELKVPLDSTGQAMTDESKVDESRAHGNFFGAKRVAIVSCFQLLSFVQQRCPLNVDLLAFHFLFFCFRDRGLLSLGYGCLVRFNIVIFAQNIGRFRLQVSF